MSEALFAAVRSGDVASLRTQLEQDPSLASARDENGVSAVLVALYHRQPQARDALLAAGAEVGVLEAAALGDVERLRELGVPGPASPAPASPDSGGAASPTSPDSGGPAPAVLAARSGDGFTALHLAAFFGGPEAVGALLAAGADPDADADNTFGVRPIHSAAAVGDHASVRALLEAGADPNVRQQGGYAPLHTAAHADDVELARLLLDHGADRTARTDDGRTPGDLATGAAVRALLA